VEANMYRFSIAWLYLTSSWRSNYQQLEVGNPLTGLTPQHICAYPKPGPWLPTLYVVVVFIFIYLSLEVIVRLLVLVELLTTTIFH